MGNPKRLKPGPLTVQQVNALLADWHGPVELPEILQRAARIGMTVATPGLLTQDDIDELVDLDTLCERGDHVDLHGSYQRAAAIGASLVLDAGIRKVHTFGGDAYVCGICASVRCTNPSDITHRGRCAEIRALIKAKA